MKSYQEMVSRVCRILIEKELEYPDTIIIGDNSSGKSDVLKQLMQSDEKEQLYFIDAVNRSFDISQIGEISFPDIVYSTEISRYRLKEDVFNLKDSFYYRGPTAIEEFYIRYAEKIQKLMSRFVDIHLEIRKNDVGWSAYIDHEEVILSSGYQALIRIFLEVLYFADTKQEGIIVIDEVDEFLSVINSGKILNFLKQEFSGINFIVTTHSADLIANAENMNLILLQDDSFEVLDAGDFESVSQVYDIFHSLFPKKEKTDKQQMDQALRKLFNNKMSGIWDEKEQAELSYLKSSKLTKAQRLIVKQIEEWIG